MRVILIFFLLTVTSCGSQNTSISRSPNTFQKEFLKRVNKLRTSGCKCGSSYMPPVEPLYWNKMLEASASAHSRDMDRRKYFGHTSPSGKTIKNRIEGAGYTSSGMRTYGVGENIARGQTSIKNVMDGWASSESHCKNIMNKYFKEIGAAESNLYWVQDFGMRVPF